MKWTRYHIEHAVEALRASGEAPDLSRLNLSGANLAGANLERANLENANLERADLSGANLSGARLYSATLERATLSGATLTGADLRRAKGIASLYIPGMSSRGDVLYAVLHDNGVYIKTGCFWGTISEFREKVLQEKGPNHLYLAAADFLAAALAKKD